MIKTILLTGATGFIGSHLLKRLLSENYKLIILKRSTSNIWRIKELIKETSFYDIDTNSLQNAFQENKIDCVIHAATAYLKSHKGIGDVDKIMDSNINIASQLCELAVEYRVPYFINTGTFFEYKIKKTPIMETDSLLGYNLYATSKIAFNSIIRYYAENFGLKVINLKLFAPFGEKDNEKLFVFLIKALLNKKKIDFSGGEQKWNFTYVEDIAKAYICALKYFKKTKKYEIFNIGYSKTYSIKNAVKILEEISGKKLEINFGQKKYLENEIFYVNCNNAKAKNLLKWKPDFNFKTGLEKMYDYYLQESLKTSL